MQKVEKSAHEIHDEVARLVRAIPEVAQDTGWVEVGYPVRLDDGGDGPNWTIENVENGRDHLPAIRAVIGQVQQRFQLAR